MARSVVGPFAMEAPLGVDPRRSTVFRAVHMQQKKAAAVRIFSTPMGLTPEAKTDFAQQIEALKELRHSGIVRCYGGGFDKKDAYLAYEFIEGESLDMLLSRRQRLPWETALDYALQLSETLQYAHEHGWLHNRLRLDKVMVCAGGLEVKLLDLRRSDDSLWMTPAPPTPTQRIFLAPECQDDLQPFPSERSDIYSLGVLLFVMLTGQLPFNPDDTPEQLAANIQRTVPPNVSAISLDCPVWLSSLVAQMLDKDAIKRPYTMAATSMALNQALTRAAGGVSVAEHVSSGFNPLQIKADRQEADKVLGKKKPKKEVDNRLTNAILGTALLVVSCVLVFALIIWSVSPANEATLRERAEELIKDGDLADLNYAVENYLLPLTSRYPNTPNAEWAQQQIDEIDVSNLDRKIAVALRFGRDLKEDDEKQLLEAVRAEENGKTKEAAAQYSAIITLFSNDPEHKRTVGLAQRRLKAISEHEAGSSELEAKLSKKMAEAELALKNNKVDEARAIWESILSLYKENKEVESLVRQADELLKKHASSSSSNSPDSSSSGAGDAKTDESQN
ncbi:MAG: protein kinase [Planctomycetes bacterium]|nr:protein kinase [Planctomycetota bacterium]